MTIDETKLVDVFNGLITGETKEVRVARVAYDLPYDFNWGKYGAIARKYMDVLERLTLEKDPRTFIYGLENKGGLFVFPDIDENVVRYFEGLVNDCPMGTVRSKVIGGLSTNDSPLFDRFLSYVDGMRRSVLRLDGDVIKLRR